MYYKKTLKVISYWSIAWLEIIVQSWIIKLSEGRLIDEFRIYNRIEIKEKDNS